ncbi:hypothetical protein ACSBR2_006819 [Camellia fascicularis]
MGRNFEEQIALNEESKDVEEGEMGEQLLASAPKSPAQTSRPSSMVFKKAHTVIPAHLIAEAISTLHGLDLRWSGPITLSEMQYVQQYVFAKYPEYSNGLVEEADNIDLYTVCVNEESSETTQPDEKPKNTGPRDSSSPSFNASLSDLDRTPLEPSRLLDILTKKSSFQGNFMGNYYMTVIGEEHDFIREFVGYKDSKVVAAPETWLDLRIKGSQLSQYFRRKCKHSPKGLFSYPADVKGTRYSMHWISEAHRNLWHVLLDASRLDAEKDPLTLALHRPDFVACTVDNTHNQPSKITCLLVRRRSFDTMAPSP